jgi:predicted nucleotidyltransferase
MVDIDWLESHENLKIVDRNSIIKNLRAALEGKVNAAYMFGSYVRNNFRPDSDIDLLIVQETLLPFPIRASEFENLKTIFPRIDAFVYTPEEFKAGLSEPSFISDQADSWLQII